MADILFDAVSTGTANVAAWNHTCSGVDRLLLVCVSNNGGVLSGITYSGIPLYRLTNDIANGATNRHTQWWALLNPPIGTFQVVLAGTTVTYIGIAISYKNCRQSFGPITTETITNSGSPVTSLTTSITTTADRCWGVYAVETNVGNSAAGAGSTLRQASASFAFEIFDSNGPKTPAGLLSMQATMSSASACGSMVSIYPSLSAGNMLFRCFPS